jgi:hypothetical protein
LRRAQLARIGSPISHERDRIAEIPVCGFGACRRTATKLTKIRATKSLDAQDGRDAERVERSLAAAGLVLPKMPEFCQKTVDSDPSGGHSDQAQVRGIAGKIGNAERWPRGRRHQIANSLEPGDEGENEVDLAKKPLRRPPMFAGILEAEILATPVVEFLDPLPAEFTEGRGLQRSVSPGRNVQGFCSAKISRHSRIDL